MPNQDPSKWDDDRLKRDYTMWREITGSGRVLEAEQQERYDATRREIERRNRALAQEGKRPVIPIER